MASLCFVLCIKDRATEHCGHIPRKKIKPEFTRSRPVTLSNYFLMMMMMTKKKMMMMMQLMWWRAARPWIFTIFMWNWTLGTVSYTFCRFHFRKVLWGPQFFTIFRWNRTLATVSCIYCQPHLPKELRTLEFLAIFIWNQVLVTVSRAFFQPYFPKVLRHWHFFSFSNLNSRVPDLFHFPTTWWRCGWHDGENAAHDIRP